MPRHTASGVAPGDTRSGGSQAQKSRVMGPLPGECPAEADSKDSNAGPAPGNERMGVQGDCWWFWGFFFGVMEMFWNQVTGVFVRHSENTKKH